MASGPIGDYVARGGEKLAAALDYFRVDPHGKRCCDLGSHVGGFVDCLLGRGASRVYSVDTAYGLLAWKLRRRPSVVVMERTNAMHCKLAEPVEIVTIDVGWTRQANVLPNVKNLIAPDAVVITLIKPHYEAPRGLLKGGVLPDEEVDGVVENVIDGVVALGWEVRGRVDSPLRGHGGNREVFALLARPRL